MLKCLIFDSFYDKHRGVICYVRVFSGSVKNNLSVFCLTTQTKFDVQEIGIFTPEMQSIRQLDAGEVGYIVTGLKTLDSVKVGDTICDQNNLKLILPGYEIAVPKVFASIFTSSQDEYPKLRDSIQKLKLNDSALIFEPENIPALGFGFRCGFLGLLHLDIVRERLEREFDLDLIITTPSVEYKVKVRKYNAEVESSTSIVEKYINELTNLEIIRDYLHAL